MLTCLQRVYQPWLRLNNFFLFFLIFVKKLQTLESNWELYWCWKQFPSICANSDIWPIVTPNQFSWEHLTIAWKWKLKLRLHISKKKGSLCFIFEQVLTLYLYFFKASLHDAKTPCYTGCKSCRFRILSLKLFKHQNVMHHYKSNFTFNSGNQIIYKYFVIYQYSL